MADASTGEVPGREQAYGKTIPVQNASPSGIRALTAATQAAHDAGAAAPSSSDSPLLGAPCFASSSVRERLDISASGVTARYALEGLLGVGASGMVYAVRDRDLGRTVALKILKDAQPDPDQIQSFLAEASLHADLAHPNVLPVLELDLAADGRPYFTMHRVAGRTLLAEIEESSLSPAGAATTDPARHRGEHAAPRAAGATEAVAATVPTAGPAAHAADGAASVARHATSRRINQVVSVVIAVCNALAYAHSRGIVHQDVKPENILLGDFGEVLLLDWGSAGRVGEDGRLTSALYGTPLYMSPEQARAAHADARSDVYALGATLLHALLGRTPWWHDDPERFWAGKRAGELLPVSEPERARMPPELHAVALKALSAEPVERYATIQALRRDLENFQAGLSVAAHRYSWWARAARWCRAHPTAISTSAVALLAAGLGWAYAAHERALDARAWHLIAEFRFTSLQAASSEWSGWTRSKAQFGSFSPKALGSPDYAIAPADSGEAHEAGIVIGGDDDVVDLTCAQAFRGNLRVEWTAEGLVSGTNLNAYIGGTDRTLGTTIHLGGWGSADRLVMTSGQPLRTLEWKTLPEALRPHRPYRLVLERADRHLRLWIDGTLACDHFDAEGLAADGPQRFGFDTWSGQRVRISSVRVYRQAPALRVSPLDAPDQLYQLRQFAPALERYQEIAQAFPGTDLAVAAEFRAALCQSACGDGAGAAAALERFTAAHPRHPLAPMAIYQQLAIACAAKDHARVQALGNQLARIPDCPLYEGALEQIASTYRPLPTADDIIADPARLAVTETAAREFNAWCVRFHLDGIAVGMWGALAWSLIESGHPDLDLSLLPRYAAEEYWARCAQGRLDEAIQIRPQGVWARVVAGRLREAAMAADPTNTLELSYRCFAACRLGEPQLIRSIDPHSSWLDAFALATHADQQRWLAAHPCDDAERDHPSYTRVSALLALGRAQQVLQEYVNPRMRAWALFALGRDQEAVALDRAWPDGRLIAATHALARHEPAAAADALANLPPMHPSYSFLETSFVAPVLLLAAAGETARARAFLASAMVVKGIGEQRFWYVAAYALGRIDRAAFRAQPSQVDLARTELLAEAIRAELGGNRADENACWRQLVALPLWMRDHSWSLQEFVRWRATEAGIPLPEDWGIILPFQ